jgi:DNA-binding transcriptional LysR family regulator
VKSKKVVVAFRIFPNYKYHKSFDIIQSIVLNYGFSISTAFLRSKKAASKIIHSQGLSKIMNLRRIDLNLLLSLEALISLESVTAAARKMHVSQPSMSGSLSRLRAHFSDPLLNKTGRRMTLTPLGEMLREPVREALEKIDETISLRPNFNPLTAKRHFSICASESTVLTLLIDVLKIVETEAPGVTVELLPADPGKMVEKLIQRELDFNFSVESFCIPDHPRATVINDSFHCVVWKENRKVKNKLMLKEYLQLGHAVTQYGFDKRPGFEHFSLEKLGIRRKVEVTCTTPALLGQLVVGTQRVATLPTRLALQLSAYLPLKLFTPPVQIPPLQIAMQWHRAREHDSASLWFREKVLQVSKDMGYIPD